MPPALQQHPGSAALSTAGDRKVPAQAQRCTGSPTSLVLTVTDLHMGHCQCRNGKIFEDEQAYFCLKFNGSDLHSYEVF